MRLWVTVLFAVALGCFVADASAQFGGMMWRAPAAGGGGGTCCTRVGTLAMTEDTTGGSFTALGASPINVVAGNLLVVGCRIGFITNNTITVTDTAGNTFASVTHFQGAVSTIELFYAKNAIGNASDTIQCNYDAARSYNSIVVMQYSGASATVPVDTGGTTTAFSAAAATLSGFTTSAANEVLVCFATTESIASAYVAGASFTLQSTNNSMSAYEDRVVTATDTFTPSMSDGSHTWDIMCASFK